MRHIAIIADDLTGASDAGVQFARNGLRTTVLFNTQNLKADTEAISAAAIDTDSRAIPARDAYNHAREAAERVQEAGFQHLYKKVDSTLRGNLGPEIDGVLDAMPFDLAVVAPAFPRVGRTTLEGRHFLKGIPIDQTEIARDPKCPVLESDLPKLLESQSRRKAGLVNKQTLLSGPVATLRAVADLLAAGVQLVVFDAETEMDLLQIATMMAASPYRILWVGSAGLADHLPEVLQLRSQETAPAPTGEAAGSDKPVLLVAGSISQTTREQVGNVAAEPGVATVELDPVAVQQDGPPRETELLRCEQAVCNFLAEGHDVALTAGSAPSQVAAAKAAGERLGLDSTEVSNRIARALGKIVAHVLERQEVQGLIMTGGDTAKAICRELGVTGLQLLKELEAGVPLSRLVGSRNLPAVTKAGAFGTAETLLRALRSLKGR